MTELIGVMSPDRIPLNRENHAEYADLPGPMPCTVSSFIRTLHLAVVAVLMGIIVAMPGNLRAAEPWQALVEAAGYAYEAGRPYQAQELLEEAVGLTEPGTEPRAAVLNNLAIVLEANGYLHAAEQLYGRVVGMWTELLGPGHVNVSRTLGNLGDFHHRRGQMDEALEAYELAIATAEQSQGSDAGQVRQGLYDSYIGLLQDMGRDAETEAVRKKVRPPASQ